MYFINAMFITFQSFPVVQLVEQKMFYTGFLRALEKKSYNCRSFLAITGAVANPVIGLLCDWSLTCNTLYHVIIRQHKMTSDPEYCSTSSLTAICLLASNDAY